MALTREAIVDGLVGLLGADKVDTDEQTLKENSLDRYRKLEDIFGIYNLPIPAAVGGSWLMASVCIELITQISSATLAV